MNRGILALYENSSLPGEASVKACKAFGSLKRVLVAEARVVARAAASATLGLGRLGRRGALQRPSLAVEPTAA